MRNDNVDYIQTQRWNDRSLDLIPAEQYDHKSEEIGSDIYDAGRKMSQEAMYFCLLPILVCHMQCWRLHIIPIYSDCLFMLFGTNAVITCYVWSTI